MNEMVLGEQAQAELGRLVKEAQRNSIEAQKFAVEAGKVLGITLDRLADYKDRGFFKRCWYAVSGRTGELERANQSDLARMQQFAWTYLAKLQEQNLIQAKAIAVIRANLKEVQDEIGELADQIGAIVEKFDARLTKLEASDALQDWLLHIEVRDGFRRDSRLVCFLQIVFDCLAVIRSRNISLDEVNVRSDIDAALRKFNIDHREAMTVDGFIGGLFDEVAECGFDSFREIVDILVDGKPLGAEFILENVSGAGYSALYEFEREMIHNKALAEKISDEQTRNGLRRAAVASVLTNGRVRYTLSELGSEIIGGSLIAADVFRAANGMKDEPAPEIETVDAFDIGSLLSDHVDITHHAFLATGPTDSEKRAYLESLSLMFAVAGGYRKLDYVLSVARLFDCADSVNRMEFLAGNPKQVDMQELKAVLSGDARRFAWAVDAVMVAHGAGADGERAKSSVRQIMCKLLDYREDQVVRFIDEAFVFVSADKPEDLFSAIQTINAKTSVWQTILEFRRIALKGAFETLKASLIDASMRLSSLSLDVTMASSAVMDAAGLEMDEPFLIKAGRRVMRNSCVSKFKSLKKKAEEAETLANGPICKANSLIRMFGTKPVDFQTKSLGQIEPDGLTDSGNTSWAGNMERAYNDLSAFLDQMEKTADTQLAQIALYEEGKYRESAAENAARAREKSREKRKLAEEAKKKAVLTKGGASATCSIAFEKLDGVPFKHREVNSIVSFAGSWFVVAGGTLWKSPDGRSWASVCIPADDIRWWELHAEGDTLLLRKESLSANEKFAFSADGVEWSLGTAPDAKGDCKRLLPVRGKWLAVVVDSVPYSYVEEGIFFDSTKESTYDKTSLYAADSLNGPWKKCDTFRMDKGELLSIPSLCVSDEGFVALAGYDYSYKSNKRLKGKGASFVWSGSDNAWHMADFPRDSFERIDDVDNMSEGRIVRFCDQFVCANEHGIFVSENGRKWERVSNESFSSLPVMSRIGNVLCVSGTFQDELFLSTDGKSFVPLKIDHDTGHLAFVNDVAVLIDTSSTDGGVFTGTLKCAMG